jgi:hypothetical protein
MFYCIGLPPLSAPAIASEVVSDRNRERGRDEAVAAIDRWVRRAPEPLKGKPAIGGLAVMLHSSVYTAKIGGRQWPSFPTTGASLPERTSPPCPRPRSRPRTTAIELIEDENEDDKVLRWRHFGIKNAGDVSITRKVSFDNRRARWINMSK